VSLDHVAALIAARFPGSDRELVIGGIPVASLVESFGTPLFVYSADVLDHQWATLRETLPPRFSICYSVKANPNPALLRHFLAKGSGLEIASGGELYLALRAGCPPDRVLFAGPGKTEDELELALKHGIGEIHLESLAEADRVAAISRRLGVTARVAVRVNPGRDAQGGAMRMGGKPVPFGIDEESIDAVVTRLESDPDLDLRGIHLFTGTQILDQATLLRQYEKGVEIARRVGRRLGRPLHTLDFGGGLGIPYFANEQSLDMQGLRNGLAGLAAECQTDALLAPTRFVVEPGRYLVGEAGIYVARVTDVKVSRGRRFLVLDGGMNHHLAASGNLGQVIKRNFPLAIVNKLDAAAEDPVDVVGPLCTPLDTLAREAPLPAAEIGDLVGIFQSGAYARAASPLGFLSHATPPEVLVEHGRPRLIRRRGTYDDLLHDLPV
jgi:diaminopimelate decarboxylase